jgi:hypothetical protein
LIVLVVSAARASVGSAVVVAMAVVPELGIVAPLSI